MIMDKTRVSYLDIKPSGLSMLWITALPFLSRLHVTWKTLFAIEIGLKSGPARVLIFGFAYDTDRTTSDFSSGDMITLHRIRYLHYIKLL